MKCSQCNHENLPEAQFCVKCGAPLATGNFCKSCGAENKPGAKFCKKCGQPFDTPPDPAPEIETAQPVPKRISKQPFISDEKRVQEKPKRDTVKSSSEEPKQPSKFPIKPLWLIVGTAVIALAVGAYFLFINRPAIPEEIGNFNPTATDIKTEPTVDTDVNDENLDALAGNWKGAVENEGSSFDYEMRFKQVCELNSVCGSFSIPSISCSGEVAIKKISGKKYFFAVSNLSDGCGGTATEEYVEILSPNALRFYSDGDYGVTYGTLWKE